MKHPMMAFVHNLEKLSHEANHPDATSLINTIQHLQETLSLPNLSTSALNYLYGITFQYYEREEYNAATSLFRLLTMVAPQEHKYWMGLGASLQMDQQFALAVDAYSAAALLCENDPYAHLYAAECLLSLNLHERAREAVTAAKEISLGEPKFAALFVRLAMIEQICCSIDREV